MRIRRLLTLLIGCSVAVTFTGGCVTHHAATARIKPTAGGTVRIDKIAAAEVPPGTFARDAEVTLERVDRSDTLEAFAESAVIYEVVQALPYEYRVTATGAGRPRESVELTIDLPPRWRKTVRNDPRLDSATVRAFARNVWPQGARPLVTLEPLVGTLDAKSDALHV